MHPRPLPIVLKVCDVFINAAKQRAIGEIDPKVVEMAQVACVYDVQTTLDARVRIHQICSFVDFSNDLGCSNSGGTRYPRRCRIDDRM